MHYQIFGNCYDTAKNIIQQRINIMFGFYALQVNGLVYHYVTPTTCTQTVTMFFHLIAFHFMSVQAFAAL